MKTVGLPISHKENEHRRALIPGDVPLMAHPEMIFVESLLKKKAVALQF